MDPITSQPNQEPNQPLSSPHPEMPTTPPPTSFGPQQSPQSTYYPTTQGTSPSKNKTGLIIGLIAGGLLLILLPIIVGFAIATYQGIQNRAFAQAFMQNIVSGKVDAAVEASSDEKSRTFLTTAAGKLKNNTFIQSDSRVDPKKTSYYLYSLSGGDNKWARVIVGNADGKNQVTSFIYSTSALELIPSSKASSNNPLEGKEETTENESTPTSTATSGCPDAHSFAALVTDPQAIYYNGKYNFTDTMFFNADSTDYDFEEVTLNRYQKYKEFNNRSYAKQFTISLTGKVNSSTPATDLAKARAEKVKSDLMSISGISADRIIINQPVNDTGYYDNSVFRIVGVEINYPDSCSSTGF